MERAFSALLRVVVRDSAGRPLGRLQDLMVDLGPDPGSDPEPGRVPPLLGVGKPITTVVVDSLAGRQREVELAGSLRWRNQRLEFKPKLVTHAELPARRAGVSVRRDLLDSMVVTSHPVRRARVSEVMVEVNSRGSWVTNLDVAAATAVHRLIGREAKDAELVPITRVHFLSRRAHRAVVQNPQAWVFGLDPGAMAEVLTRLPLAQARDVIAHADEATAGRALARLHPSVRSRVTKTQPPKRRMLRTHGWRLHRPTHPETQRETPRESLRESQRENPRETPRESPPEAESGE